MGTARALGNWGADYRTQGLGIWFGGVRVSREGVRSAGFLAQGRVYAGCRVQSSRFAALWV